MSFDSVNFIKGAYRLLAQSDLLWNVMVAFQELFAN